MILENNNINSNGSSLNKAREDKVKGFKLNIDSENLKVGRAYRRQEGIEDAYSESLNSFSHSEVKEKMEKNSRNFKRAQLKEEKKQEKFIDKENTGIFRIIWWVSVALVGIMLSTFAIVGLNDFLAINRKSEDTVVVSIPENPSIKEVSKILEDKGVINDSKFFRLYTGLTKSNDAFSQGTYEIATNKDYEAIINYLQSMANRTDTVFVTIPEGLTVRETAELLKENTVLNDVDKFLELCNSDIFDEDFEFIKNIDNADDRYYKLEGYLFPDTYECYVNEDPEDTIWKMLNAYEMRIYDEQEVESYGKEVIISELIEDSEYSMDQILIMASIIQAEAANLNDMYYIGSVLHNRLEADVDLGVSFLGLDSTIYYPYSSLDDIPDDIKDTFVSNYNTYNFMGLPAGAICNPGLDAILAALYPNDTSYMYFCHDKHGQAYYASTLYEHNANLSKIG